MLLVFISWSNHKCGYFIDYYYSGPVDVMCEVMENCIKIIEENQFSSNIFPENVLTYSILNKTNFRKINYTCSEEIEFYFLNSGKYGGKTIKDDISQLRSGLFCFKQDFPNDYQLV